MLKGVSVIYLVNKKKEILFQLRDNKQTISWPDYWGLIGGEIENGETPEEAIRREVFEEINYNLGDIERICEAKSIDQLTKKQNQIYFFRGDITLNENEIRLNEGQKVSFFNAEEITTTKIPPIAKKIFHKNKEKILCI